MFVLPRNSGGGQWTEKLPTPFLICYRNKPTTSDDNAAITPELSADRCVLFIIRLLWIYKIVRRLIKHICCMGLCWFGDWATWNESEIDSPQRMTLFCCSDVSLIHKRRAKKQWQVGFCCLRISPEVCFVPTQNFGKTRFHPKYWKHPRNQKEKNMTSWLMFLERSYKNSIYKNIYTHAYHTKYTTGQSIN